MFLLGCCKQMQGSAGRTAHLGQTTPPTALPSWLTRMRWQLFMQPLTSMDCNIMTSAHGRTGNLWMHALHVQGMRLRDEWRVLTLPTGLVTSRVRLLTMLGDGNRKMTQNRRSYRNRKSGKKTRRSYEGTSSEQNRRSYGTMQNRSSYGFKSGKQNRRSKGGKNNRISETGEKVHRRRKTGLSTVTMRTKGTVDGWIGTGGDN